MKKSVLIGLLLLLCGIADAKTTTLYFRSDTHTINTATGYILAILNSSSPNKSTLYSAGSGGSCYGASTTQYISAIALRHADGSETVIASGALAPTTRRGNSQGIQSATWNCPSTTMLPTDALKITYSVDFYMDGYYFGTLTAVWISDVLRWGKLNATTWTFYRYTISTAQLHTCNGGLFFGDSSYTTYVDGIDYVLADGGYAIMY